MKKYFYNLYKDPIDDRDYKFSTLIMKKEPLPDSADLRKGYSIIKDQGRLGACTAFSACSVMEYILNKNIDLSELYFYYKEREADGTIGTDSGSSIRQSAKIAIKAGTCEEEIYPYDIMRFSDTPPEEANTDAKNHKVKAYYRIHTLEEIMYTLGVLSKPVLIRTDVYESFENTGSDGNVAIPDVKNEQFLGYHAVNICGYYWVEDKKSDNDNWFTTIIKKILKKTDKYNGLYFILRNSWGDEFGDNGYMYASAEFIKNFSDDWWYLEA